MTSLSVPKRFHIKSSADCVTVIFYLVGQSNQLIWIMVESYIEKSAMPSESYCS